MIQMIKIGDDRSITGCCVNPPAVIYIYIYTYIYIYIYWLVVWNMNFIFPETVGNVINYPN